MGIAIYTNMTESPKKSVDYDLLDRPAVSARKISFWQHNITPDRK